MPIEPNDIYDRGIPRAGQVRREEDIDFSALIYEMAEGISEAQVKLDYNTAEAAAHFADVEVPVVPQVTRRIDEDGRVTTTAGKREKRNLLELGFTPTRYHFDDVRMDIEFDLKLHVDEDEETTLRASTSEAHHNRKFEGDVDTTAKLSATLVPVPTPTGLTPAEAYETGPGADRTGGPEGGTDTSETETGDEGAGDA